MIMPLPTTDEKDSESADGLSPCPRSVIPFFDAFNLGSRSSHHAADTLRQVLVRTDSGTLVFRLDAGATVNQLCHCINVSTGVPVDEQRLIYAGRQLSNTTPLADLVDGAILNLTYRLRSAKCPKSWLVADEITSAAFALRDPTRQWPHDLDGLIKVFISLTPNDNFMYHVEAFIGSGAAAALVMLYATSKLHRGAAEMAIQLFLNGSLEFKYAALYLEFCQKLSAAVPKEDSLYIRCRSSLASALIHLPGMPFDPVYSSSPSSWDATMSLLPYFEEIADSLYSKLNLCLGDKLSPLSLCWFSDLCRDFSNFLAFLKREIQCSFGSPEWVITLRNEACRKLLWDSRICSVHQKFLNLLKITDQCLKLVEEHVKRNGAVSELQCNAWFPFLSLLTDLNDIDQIFSGAGDVLHSVLLARRVPLNALLSRAKSLPNSFRWFLNHRDVTNYETRRNFALMLFPSEKQDFEDYYEMLIDRSQLLTESFEYILHTDPSHLHNGLLIEFKNEEATGPGVIREWLCLLCRELFSPENVLFLQCPNDCRRFFPNPASSVDPMHLDYFEFCGRIIALALMHKVQVGVVFDRVFFMQLAGNQICLEDVQDADPVFYASCKKILEMEAEFLDSDALGLTFVKETETMGSRQIVELCSEGAHITVNSANRKYYVELLIEHQFIRSTSDQVTRFSQGFSSILSSINYQRLFFQGLEPDDFDQMLGGSDSNISMEDWRAHTEYKGYKNKENDLQVMWFWKVVEGMSMEQRRILLTFWTSIRHLPAKGFGGLPNKLCLMKILATSDHLPTSHTCFYQLCLPVYPSLSTMRARLHWIAQEHVGSSFGTW